MLDPGELAYAVRATCVGRTGDVCEAFGVRVSPVRATRTMWEENAPACRVAEGMRAHGAEWGRVRCGRARFG